LKISLIIKIFYTTIGVDPLDGSIWELFDTCPIDLDVLSLASRQINLLVTFSIDPLDGAIGEH